MVRCDDLQHEGLVLYQDDTLPCFTQDSVHLVHFLRLKSRDRVLDIGCGNGILCVLGASYTGASFTGIDISGEQIALARRSCGKNGQDIAFYQTAAGQAPTLFGCGSFTAVVCNPPYFHDGEHSQAKERDVARHGMGDVLAEMLRCAFLVLKNGGHAFFCYPADDMALFMHRLYENRLTPKRVQFVAHGGNHPPRLVLVEAVKDGGDGVRYEKTLPEDTAI